MKKEETLRNKIKRTLIMLICAASVLIAGGGIFTFHLQNTRDKSEKNQLELEVEEYKNRIANQIREDFIVLNMMSLLLDADDTSDYETLANRLTRANENNTFLTMVYYNVNGEGIICTSGKEPLIGANLNELSDAGRKAVEESFNGTASLSNLFESRISENRVFVYSVPVYDGDKIIGALAASDHISIFSDIVEGNTVLGGGGYIHMLDSEGNFLIRSSHMIVQEDIPSIFNGPYLSDSSEEKIKEAFDRQDSAYSSFSYNGRSYPFLIEPVGINDWYFFCVNTGEGIGSEASSFLYTTQIIFVIVIILMIFMMCYSYKLMRNHADELIILAYYDSLTGAENMPRFLQRLKQTIDVAGRNGSVTVISIRQFRFLNEIFGKSATESLLKLIKNIIDESTGDDEFFCRDTNDRFYIYFNETDENTVRNRIGLITDKIESRSQIGGKDYKLVFDCGVSVSRNDDSEGLVSSDMIMNRLPFALDMAKSINAAHGTIWFFDTELHKKEGLENYIESHMQQALRDGEFKLFLQPQKHLKSGLIESAEALVRWQTNSGRMIFPDQFIPLFESNGFCVQLDLYVLEQVCKRLRTWLTQGTKVIQVSINQSKRLFFEEDYIDRLKEILDRYEIPPSLITLEILEGLALENVDELNEKISRLRSEGFKISLDDFGSGFSSLNTLGKLQINELKLDRDFLIHASDKYKDRIRLIMKEVVQMSRKLGIYTVAEGVETEEDEKLIKDIGFDIGQGYLYSRPLSADDFEAKYIKS